MLKISRRFFVILICFHYVVTEALSMDDMKLEEMNKRLEKLETIVLQEKPYLSVCAEISSTKSERQWKTINYDSIFHSSTNIDGGGLDICTGVFTAGQSGTYSVSWNSFSGARGPLKSLLLRKNGRKVAETMQSRTVLIDVEKGDTLDLYYYNYGVERLTFCISLNHAHDIKQEEVQKAPKLSILPVSKHTTDSTKSYFVKLSTNISQTGNNNYDIAQNVADSFEHNHRNSSQACGDNQIPRECEKVCNFYDKRQCNAGCAFDYETLGECKDMPYGYVNNPGEEGNINPCFFLKFNPYEYWNPGGEEMPRRVAKAYSHDLSYSYELSYSYNDQFQFDCVGKVETEELELYAQLLQSRNETTRPHSQFAEYFVNEKELFEELAELGENIDKFVAIQQYLSEYKTIIYGKKMRETFANYQLGYNKDLDAKSKTLLEEYLDDDNEFTYYKNYYTLGNVVDFMKILQKLKKNQRETMYEEITKVIDNGYEYISMSKFCAETLRICVEDDMFCPYCTELSDIIQKEPDMLILYLDTIQLIEHIGYDDDIYKDQDLLTYVIDNKSILEGLHQDPDMNKIFENKLLLDQMMKYGDNVIKFAEVKRHLREQKKNKDKIKITFYPESQGIPKKYFPLTGDEETPYVAMKLHLQDKPWLSPGQEVLVECRAWYEGAVHDLEGGSGMVEFKIILQ